MGSARERESAAEVIRGLRARHPCPCTVQDCPFRGLCCVCVRNHLEDGTLPACCLPPVRWRSRVDKYPECRSPALWVLWLADRPEQIPEGLRGEVAESALRLAAALRKGLKGLVRR